MQIVNNIINNIMNDPRFRNNPTMQNAFKMYREGNAQGIENLARNVCNAQGRNINDFLGGKKNV